MVLGYGAHEDMVGALLPAIEEARATAKEAGRDLYFVATVCGTTKDPQNYQSSVDRLKEGGVLVAESNTKAVQLALLLKGIEISEDDKSGCLQRTNCRCTKTGRKSNGTINNQTKNH